MSSLLDSYMKQRGMTDAQFATVIGRDRSLVNRLRNGSVRPTLELAAVIESKTLGEVPMRSWVEQPDLGGFQATSATGLEPVR